jgi:hypothetical protein
MRYVKAVLVGSSTAALLGLMVFVGILAAMDDSQSILLAVLLGRVAVVCVGGFALGFVWQLWRGRPSPDR